MHTNLLNGTLPKSLADLSRLQRVCAAPLGRLSRWRLSWYVFGSLLCAGRDVSHNMFEDPIPDALVSKLGSTGGLVLFPQTCPAGALRLGQDMLSLGRCVSAGVRYRRVWAC